MHLTGFLVVEDEWDEEDGEKANGTAADDDDEDDEDDESYDEEDGEEEDATTKMTTTMTTTMKMTTTMMTTTMMRMKTRKRRLPSRRARCSAAACQAKEEPPAKKAKASRLRLVQRPTRGQRRKRPSSRRQRSSFNGAEGRWDKIAAAVGLRKQRCKEARHRSADGRLLSWRRETDDQLTTRGQQSREAARGHS